MDHDEDISQNYSRLEKARIIDSILSALNDERIDPGLKKKMQAWILGDFDENPAKQDAFVRYAGKIKPHEGELTDEDLIKYKKLLSRLGIELPATNESIAPPKRRSVSAVWKAAAILIPTAAAAAGFWFISGNTVPDGPPEMMIAASDQFRSAFLPDSSFVSVSPGSTVFYHEDGVESRMVDLSGEAMFRVRKDNGRSFSVSTTNMTVNVHGTDFSVSEYPGSPSGTVELYDGSLSVAAGGDSTTLSRGEMLSCDFSSHGADVSVIPASRMIEKGYKPRLKFNGATFGEVIASLSAFHGVEIEIAQGVNMNTGNISGDIESKTLENALRTIMKMWEQNVAQKSDGEKIIIYRK